MMTIQLPCSVVLQAVRKSLQSGIGRTDEVAVQRLYRLERMLTHPDVLGKETKVSVDESLFDFLDL